jgi:putative membrane protein
VLKLLLKVGVNAVAIWVAVTLVDGLHYDDAEGLAKLAVLGLVLGLLNGLVKPIVTFLSLPALLLTLGLFLLVINIAMFGLLVLLSDTFDFGLTAPGGFWAIALGGLIVSVVVWVGELVIPDGD